MPSNRGGSIAKDTVPCTDRDNGGGTIRNLVKVVRVVMSIQIIHYLPTVQIVKKKYTVGMGVFGC